MKARLHLVTDTIGLRRFSTEAYHRMGEASVFGHEEHVELVRGVIRASD